MKILYLEDEHAAALQAFQEECGMEEFVPALWNHTLNKRKYFFENRGHLTRIPLESIYYIKVSGHHVDIHTTNRVFRKYSSLTKEYAYVHKLGFVKCNQNTLVPLNNIAEIQTRWVILKTGERFFLSRSYANDVVSAFRDLYPSDF